MDADRLKDIQDKKAALQEELNEARKNGAPAEDLAAISTLIDTLQKEEDEAKQGQ